MDTYVVNNGEKFEPGNLIRAYVFNSWCFSDTSSPLIIPWLCIMFVFDFRVETFIIQTISLCDKSRVYLYIIFMFWELQYIALLAGMLQHKNVPYNSLFHFSLMKILYLDLLAVISFKSKCKLQCIQNTKSFCIFLITFCFIIFFAVYITFISWALVLVSIWIICLITIFELFASWCFRY